MLDKSPKSIREDDSIRPNKGSSGKLYMKSPGYEVFRPELSLVGNMLQIASKSIEAGE